MQYIQPDKPAQMFINEVGVDPTHHRMGLGGRLLEALLETARQLHCTEAWVAVDLDNEPARTLYTAAGGPGDDTLIDGPDNQVGHYDIFGIEHGV